MSKDISSITMDDFVLSSQAKPIDPEFEKDFARIAHAKNVLSQDDQTNTLEFHVIEHLRVAALYWGIMAMDLIGGLHLLPKEKVLDFVMKCYDTTTGGFAGNINHDTHILYTQAAVQILYIYDHLHVLDVQKTISYITSLQRPDGSFCGDKYGEVDTRFSYAAIHTLSLLSALPSLTPEEKDIIRLWKQGQYTPSSASDGDNGTTTTPKQIDLVKAIIYILSCQNLDGGFGARQTAESHAGQIFVCMASLAITECVDLIDNITALQWWLASRQLPCGGLNGRPEKLQDVCYSWWVLSSMSTLDCVHYINKEKLVEFIKSSQDMVEGGISERPDMMTDTYHTYFGFAGLSLLGCPGFEPIDPVYAMPVRVIPELHKKWKTALQKQLHSTKE